jgi:hypothetical protein
MEQILSSLFAILGKVKELMEFTRAGDIAIGAKLF